jgi:hypothetical protein
VWTIVAMTTTRSMCLTLELRSDGERIAGRLRDRHGNEWPFSSWLGLLTLIERLRASAPSSTEEPNQQEVS